MDRQIVVDITTVLEHPDVPNVRYSINKSDVSELKKSIAERGLKNPIVVFKQGKDCFLVSGFRRRCALLELHNEDLQNKAFIEVPAILRTYSKEEFITEAMYDNLIENIQRKDITPIEIADRIKILIEMKKNKKEIAKQIGKSTTWINEVLRFFDEATDEVKQKVRTGEISLEEAKKVAHLPRDKQGIVATGLSVVNKDGNSGKKREIKQSLDEATRVRSHRSRTKKEIKYMRNLVASLIVVEEIPPNEKSALKIFFAALCWVLGEIEKNAMESLAEKYHIKISKNGFAAREKPVEKTE